MADNGKKAKKIYSILTYIYLVGFLGFLLLGPSPYYVKCGRRSYRDKACYSNIRVITGAVEMYNMDHETFMENLDEDLLVKDGYLKTKQPRPETACNYRGSDLTGSGTVYCDYHGDLEGTRPDLSKGPPLSPLEKKQEQIHQYLNQVMEKIPYALLWPVLLVLIGYQMVAP
ncbi:MAG: hypothetical protein II961_00905 [Candidatus Riflebacteria bacterium]|nr:hypothetical protein [Candidatus Riflebacteria bacterium]